MTTTRPQIDKREWTSVRLYVSVAQQKKIGGTSYFFNIAMCITPAMSYTSPRSRTRSPSKARAVVAVAQLSPSANRTRYAVYALENTARHDAFLNRLWNLLPPSATRAQIAAAVAAAGARRYRLRGDLIVTAVGESLQRRLFSPTRRSRGKR